MPNKPTKEWGTIGGLESMSQNWSEPAEGWAFWPLYDKCSDYSESVYTGYSDSLQTYVCLMPTPDYGTQTPDEIVYYDFSFQTGHPLSKLTIRRGMAKKKPEESCCRYLDWRIF